MACYLSRLFCVTFYFPPFCFRVAFILFFPSLNLDCSVSFSVLLVVTLEIVFYICNLLRSDTNSACTTYPVRTFNHCCFPFLLPRIIRKCHVLLFSLYFRAHETLPSSVRFYHSSVLHSCLRVSASVCDFLLTAEHQSISCVLPVMHSLFYLEKKSLFCLHFCWIQDPRLAVTFCEHFETQALPSCC